VARVALTSAALLPSAPLFIAPLLASGVLGEMLALAPSLSSARCA
jgi:hypothetical protein